MESIPGDFNVHLAPIEAPGCATTTVASTSVSLDCQVQASIHHFNDKARTSPLAQREASIDRITDKASAAPLLAARNWYCSRKRLLGVGRGGIERPVDLRCA